MRRWNSDSFAAKKANTKLGNPIGSSTFPVEQESCELNPRWQMRKRGSRETLKRRFPLPHSAGIVGEPPVRYIFVQRRSTYGKGSRPTRAKGQTTTSIEREK